MAFCALLFWLNFPFISDAWKLFVQGVLGHQNRQIGSQIEPIGLRHLSVPFLRWFGAGVGLEGGGPLTLGSAPRNKLPCVFRRSSWMKSAPG
jgi:hypothetical protein